MQAFHGTLLLVASRKTTVGCWHEATHMGRILTASRHSQGVQQLGCCSHPDVEHLFSVTTNLGSTPLGNIEKSVRAVNTLATSETERPMGPPMSLFSSSGMIPALQQRSSHLQDRQQVVVMWLDIQCIALLRKVLRYPSLRRTKICGAESTPLHARLEHFGSVWHAALACSASNTNALHALLSRLEGRPQGLRKHCHCEQTLLHAGQSTAGVPSALPLWCSCHSGARRQMLTSRRSTNPSAR